MDELEEFKAEVAKIVAEQVAAIELPASPAPQVTVEAPAVTVDNEAVVELLKPLLDGLREPAKVDIDLSAVTAALTTINSANAAHGLQMGGVLKDIQTAIDLQANKSNAAMSEAIESISQPIADAVEKMASDVQASIAVQSQKIAAMEAALIKFAEASYAPRKLILDEQGRPVGVEVINQRSDENANE